jgi:hypothetical protein
MNDPFRDNESLTRGQLDRPILQVDQEFSLDDVEELVEIIVLVPVILPLHHAKPDDRIIDLTQRLVVPAVFTRLHQPLNVDDLQRRMQDVQVRRVGIGTGIGHERDGEGLKTKTS